MNSNIDNLLSELLESGNVTHLSKFRVKEFKRVGIHMPEKVLEYIKARKTRIDLLDSRQIGTGRLGYASATGNYMAMMTTKVEARTLHYSTFLHEVIHIAKPDFRIQGIWAGLEDEVLSIGKHLYEMAKKIVSNPDDFDYDDNYFARKVVAQVTTLLSCRGAVTGTMLAHELRSTYFTCILNVAKHVKSLNISTDVEDGYNARWMGQCIVAYVEKYLNSGKRLTVWSNVEEAICEKYSYDLKSADALFNRLWVALHPPAVDEDEEDPIEERLRAFGFYKQSATKTRKKAREEIVGVIRKALDKGNFVHMAKKGTIIQLIESETGRLLSSGRGWIGLLKEVWRSEL